MIGKASYLHEKPDALREQVQTTIFFLRNHIQAWEMSRDEKRGLLMCIQRLERGLEGHRDTDPARTLADWITA